MDRLTENEELTLAVVKRAQAGQHSKFDYIRNLNGLRGVARYFNGAARLKNGFKKVSQKVLSDYTKSISNKYTKVDPLITYNNLKVCEKFYEDEQSIAKEMIREYIAYLSSGHLIETLLGFDRPEDDLRDYRK